ncbi:unnamed protein product [Cuscuta campestris]|uniref:Uncharacterized protein n=1 Tax=Cuscuta campestris TaxID=132261 RepID=A0A484NC52_9ASTE|nr:unnamed protein product [Cuscuta campestris]
MVPGQETSGHLTELMFSWIFAATCRPMHSVQYECRQELLLNISPPGFQSIQISQNATEDSPASDCSPGVWVFVSEVLDAAIETRTEDIRASCICSSSAYFSSETGKIWSSS